MKKRWTNINGKWLLIPDTQKAMKGVKFIPCSEDSQVYNWQRTNKKAWENYENGPTRAYVSRSIEDVKKEVKKKKR